MIQNECQDVDDNLDNWRSVSFVGNEEEDFSCYDFELFNPL